jgi:hypothetical protein
MNYKHGTRQRKVWRKLHIAIEDGEILAHTLTIHTISDTAEVSPLVEQIDSPISEALGDGGYDHTATYASIDKHNANKSKNSTVITIPPNIGFQKIRNSDHKERRRNQGITIMGAKIGNKSQITVDVIKLKARFQDGKGYWAAQ